MRSSITSHTQISPDLAGASQMLDDHVILVAARRIFRTTRRVHTHRESAYLLERAVAPPAVAIEATARSTPPVAALRYRRCIASTAIRRPRTRVIRPRSVSSPSSDTCRRYFISIFAVTSITRSAAYMINAIALSISVARISQWNTPEPPTSLPSARTASPPLEHHHDESGAAIRADSAAHRHSSTSRTNSRRKIHRQQD
jgi:hypothetical protein